MSRQYIDDHQIISKYLGDQLSDHDRTEFEAYWAQHPEITDELEIDARLESGLAHLQASRKLDHSNNARSTHRSVWPIALAASLIAGVGIALWMGGAGSVRTVTLAASIAALSEAHDGNSPLVQSVDLLHARGTLYDAVIELPKTPVILELHLLPEGIPASAKYAVSLLEISSGGKRAELGTVAGLGTDADGFLTVYVDAAGLEPAQYELRVQGAQPAVTNEMDSFLIKVDAAVR